MTTIKKLITILLVVTLVYTKTFLVKTKGKKILRDTEDKEVNQLTNEGISKCIENKIELLQN